jgi:hypothetical protein
MTLARDDYPAYFAEKLWEWLPASYRELDRLEGGDALRALVESLAEQAALLKRSQDRLWDDAFVELASDWAVPYLGELVGTRLVSALNRRARRVDVAKTIYYRRRKGTVALLEQLIADIADWNGKVVEEMRRLARMRHALDGAPRAGRVTQTPEGGLADLRAVRGAELVQGPFDEFHYTPEMRPPNGGTGRRGITRLSFHLFRLRAVELTGVQPRRMKRRSGSHQGFTCDPSGRDIPLFSRPDSGRSWSAWRTPDEWGLPRAISCWLLNDAAYLIGTKEIDWILDASPAGAPIADPAQRAAAARELLRISGVRFDSAAKLLRILAGLPGAATLTRPDLVAGLLRRALVDECGSAALFPDAAADGAAGAAASAGKKPSLALSFLEGSTRSVVPRDSCCAGNLDNWSLAAPGGVDWVVHPETGRFLLNRGGRAFASIRVDYQVGMLAPIGAGSYGREDASETGCAVWSNGSPAEAVPKERVAQIRDSASYANPPDQLSLSNWTLRAAKDQRPYLRLTNFWRLKAGGSNAELTLDGLWIGTRSIPRSVVLESATPRADFERVTLRHCTLDPGGEDANGARLPPVTLVIDGSVEELVIEGCILAGIHLQGENSRVTRLIMRDSMVHTQTEGAVPINVPTAHLEMERCTVLASDLSARAVNVERIDASNTLVAGTIQVADAQSGCFRFSASAKGSLLPRQYRSFDLVDPALFASRRFGDPEYLQLSPTAPPGVRRGADNGCEMGAFCSAIVPVKLDGLLAKIDEYLPFGRLPNLIIEN